MVVALTIMALMILGIAGYGWVLALLGGVPPERRGRYFLGFLVTVMTLQTVSNGLSSAYMQLLSPEASRSVFLLLAGLGGYAGLLALLFCRPGRLGGPLTMGYVVYYALSVLAILGSTSPSFPLGLLFAPLIIFGILVSIQGGGVEFGGLIRVLRRALAGIVLGSLALWVAAPSLAATSYGDSLVGIPVRLHGMTPHANTLGPLSATYLLLLLAPVARGRYWTLLAGAAAVTLLFSQSKTSILALIACTTVMAFLRIHGGGTLAWAKRLLSVGVMGAAITLMLPALQGRVSEDENLTTLTGRTDVWAMTLTEYASNPCCGYGPLLWNPDYAMEQGMPWATQAHNLFVQTLGMSGWLGALGLAVVLLVMLAGAWRSVHRPFAVALLALMLIRAFTETPLNYISTDLYRGWSWLMLAVLVAAQRSSGHRQQLPKAQLAR